MNTGDRRNVEFSVRLEIPLSFEESDRVAVSRCIGNWRQQNCRKLLWIWKLWSVARKLKGEAEGGDYSWCCRVTTQ
jgi:hypothetical protein